MRLFPKSTIKLIKAPFDSVVDSAKIKWITQDAQTEFFEQQDGMTLSTLQYNNVSSGVISIATTYESLANYNYMFFQSNAYNNKTFYCFIRSVKQIRSGLCHVHFIIDNTQTWLYDGSQLKYTSNNPESEYKSIIPESLQLPHGSQSQFQANFCDGKHITSFAKYERVYGVEGITISETGKISVSNSVPTGSIYKVLARDPITGKTAEATVTIV